MYLALYLHHLQCYHTHTLAPLVDATKHIIIHRNHNSMEVHIAIRIVHSNSVEYDAFSAIIKLIT